MEERGSQRARSGERECVREMCWVGHRPNEWSLRDCGGHLRDRNGSRGYEGIIVATAVLLLE